MYNLPFNDNYILGHPFHSLDIIDKFIKHSKYINIGISFFNLKKIRNNEKKIEIS